MTNIIPIRRSEPDPPQGLKMLLALNRRKEGQLFRTAGQARRYFGAVSCAMPSNDYGGAFQSMNIAEDIFAISHAEYLCARTTEKIVQALMLAMRNAGNGQVYNFRLIDAQGSVFIGYADGETFTLKIASDYKETTPDGTESFGRILSMEFQIAKGQAFLVGQSTER